MNPDARLRSWWPHEEQLVEAMFYPEWYFVALAALASLVVHYELRVRQQGDHGYDLGCLQRLFLEL